MASRGFYETAGGSTFKESARAGLGPAIHVFRCMDGRIKSGHDDFRLLKPHFGN
jgi:hypothetical protein